MPVTGAHAAASASVGERHQADRIVGNGQVGIEIGVPDRDDDCPGCCALIGHLGRGDTRATFRGNGIRFLGW